VYNGTVYHSNDKVLDAKNVKHFVLDKCNKMLEQLGQSCEFGAHRSHPSVIIYVNHYANYHIDPVSYSKLFIKLFCNVVLMVQHWCSTVTS
jgi:hypothetical protein